MVELMVDDGTIVCAVDPLGDGSSSALEFRRAAVSLSPTVRVDANVTLGSTSTSPSSLGTAVLSILRTLLSSTMERRFPKRDGDMVSSVIGGLRGVLRASTCSC